MAKKIEVISAFVTIVGGGIAIYAFMVNNIHRDQTNQNVEYRSDDDFPGMWTNPSAGPGDIASVMITIVDSRFFTMQSVIVERNGGHNLGSKQAELRGRDLISEDFIIDSVHRLKVTATLTVDGQLTTQLEYRSVGQRGIRIESTRTNLLRRQ